MAFIADRAACSLTVQWKVSSTKRMRGKSKQLWHNTAMDDTSIGFGSQDISDLDSERLAEYFEALQSARKEHFAEMKYEFNNFHGRLRRRYGPAFDEMDLLHSCALEATGWSSATLHESLIGDQDQEKFAYRYNVIQGLMARSLSAYAEVTWLLRGGFPGGALTRVRLMHELYVTASALVNHGQSDGEYPQLFERYINHKDVFTPGVAQDILETGILDPKHPLDSKTIAVLEKRKVELVEKYGKDFTQMWGWAAPLFPKGKKISMRMMGGLSGSKLHYLYSMASSHAHAGSEGWHSAHTDQGSEKLLISGPVDSGLAVPAELANAFLLGISEMIIPTCIEKDGSVDDSGAYAYVALTKISENITNYMTEGEVENPNYESSLEADATEGVLQLPHDHD